MPKSDKVAAKLPYHFSSLCPLDQEASGGLNENTTTDPLPPLTHRLTRTCMDRRRWTKWIGEAREQPERGREDRGD